jgi:hypothetical protein
MVRQIAETDGISLTGPPAGGFSVSNGPTRIMRGVAMFALALAATGIVLHVAGARGWGTVIAVVAAMIASILTLAVPFGNLAQEGFGDKRDRKVRLSGKRRLFEIVVGLALLVVGVSMLITQLAGWSVVTGDTRMVILSSLLTVSFAGRVVLEPRLGGAGEAVEEA